MNYGHPKRLLCLGREGINGTPSLFGFCVLGGSSEYGHLCALLQAHNSEFLACNIRPIMKGILGGVR